MLVLSSPKMKIAKDQMIKGVIGVRKSLIKLMSE